MTITLDEQIACIDNIHDCIIGDTFKAALVASLRELKAAQRDADRYRWLRGDGCYVADRDDLISREQEVPVALWVKYGHSFKDNDIDAAIDATMTGEGK